MPNPRGFTLIELLVVIAIIGVLSAVILTSLNQSRSKALHTQTAAEIGQLKSAFVQVADDNNGHPISTGGNLVCLGTTSCWGGTATNNATVDAALAKYIKVPPVDQSSPTANTGYFMYKSPGSYIPCTAWSSCSGTTITGSSNSYSLIWVPAYLPANTAPSDPNDCVLENGAYGVWDGGSWSGGSQHCGGLGLCRQCGVLIEQ